MMKVLTNFDASKETTSQIMQTVISNFDVQGDLNQMEKNIHPIISNAMFQRDKDLLQQERFETLIILSRTLDDISISKCIDALGYKLTK
jgi:hypothetical protein